MAGFSGSGLHAVGKLEQKTRQYMWTLKQNNFRPAAEFRFPGVKPKLRGLPTSCLCRRHTREGGAGGEKTLSFSGSTNIDGPCAGNSALFSCVFQNWGFFGSAMSCSGFLNATTSGR